MTHSPSLSIVIPVYNSQPGLHELVERIERVVAANAYTAELILVNDGSKDQSWNTIVGLAKARPWIIGIDHMRNYGQHNALLTGILAAGHDVIITMDDDLQHPPEEIPKLLAKLAEGYDVVYGTPDYRKHHFGRNIGSSFIQWLMGKAMRSPIARVASSFRAFRSSLVPVFLNYKSDYVYIDAILSWATTKFTMVVVRHDARKYGKSNYNLRRLIVHAMNAITGYSVIPLQIASFLGFLFMTFGTLLFAYVIWNYLSGTAMKGFTFIAATIALFSGVQLFCIGIIGAYLARIHLRNMGKPVALIRQTTADMPDGK